MFRLLRYLVEFVAAFVGVAILLALLLAWRLRANPVSSDFLTPYIQTGIESIVPDGVTHLDSTLLTWNRSERAILVHIENLKISDSQGDEIANIPSFDAKISLLGLIFGQFMPKDLSIDHPQIKVKRLKNGGYSFGIMSVGGGAPSRQDPEALSVVVRNIFEHFSHALLIHRLAVMRAVIDVQDESTQKDWFVSVPEIAIERPAFAGFERATLTGHATVEVTQQNAIASVDLRYAYDPEKETHTLSTLFADVTPAFLAGGHPETLGLGAARFIDLPLTGKIKLTLDKDFAVDMIAAQVHGDSGFLHDDDLWDKPFAVKSFDLNASYDKETRHLTVSNTHADFGGATLDLTVEGVPSTQKDKDLDYTAQMTIDNLPMNAYGDFVPKPVLLDPRYWLTANLRDGVFSHAEAGLKGSFAWNDLANFSLTEGGGKVIATNGRVIYLDGMPPAEGVDAEAVFDLKKMEVKITRGGIGAIRIQPFSVTITGLDETDQVIDIPLQVEGPLPDILRLLDHPPLGYAKALGIAPEDLGGKIEGQVIFRFPLLKTLLMKDVFLQTSATASGVASTKLIPGLAIDQGNLGLSLDMNGFKLDGQTLLDKVPFHVVWQENFEKKPGQFLRRATINGVVRDDQWSNFGTDIFNGTKGSILVSVEMTKENRDKTKFVGSLDMTGAALAVDQLNWKKPANLPATLKWSAQVLSGKPVEISSITLRGARIMADGYATLSPDMSQLLSLNLSPFVLGRTNVSLHFLQTFGEGGALRFEAKGASLDVGGLRGGKDPAQADPRPKEYHIQVKKLYTDTSGEIDDAKVYAARDQKGWSAISVHGLADGDMPLSIELTPQPDGRRTFSIFCENFGKGMKGLGFTDRIKGGKLVVSGESTIDNPRVINGKIKIGEFTVEKLPVLALLLNATSPFGFSGLVTDSADFSQFKGQFHWQGDVLTLTQAHAAGSAIGINIDGKVNMNTNDANLQGTLVPFSAVNKILDYIPIIGDLITGGEDQGVLAVAYQIKGSLNSPKISVNPASLLTPGFLRNLFFRDDATDEDSNE